MEDVAALVPKTSAAVAAALVLGGGAVVLGAAALAQVAGPGAAAGLVAALALLAGARGRRAGDREAALGAVAVAAAAALAVVARVLVRSLGEAPATIARVVQDVAPAGPDLAWVAAASAALAPAVSAARVLRQPWSAVLAPPRPLWPAALAAVVAAAVLFPLVCAADLHGRALVASAVGGVAPDASVAAVLDATAPGLPTDRGLLASWLALAVVLPSLEVLLHGVVRRAAERVGRLPFVVATAVAAPVLLAPEAPAPGVYVAALVTGALARRTGSVLPGVVFWQALAAAETVWGPLA